MARQIALAASAFGRRRPAQRAQEDPMTSTTENASNGSVPAWHAEFLHMVPAIRRHTRALFQHLSPQERSDALAEVTAVDAATKITVNDKAGVFGDLKADDPVSVNYAAKEDGNLATSVTVSRKS
jgi:hypothetical protein